MRRPRDFYETASWQVDALTCRAPRCPNRGPGYSPTRQDLAANRLLGPIHGRGVRLLGSGVTWWISCGRSLFTVQTARTWNSGSSQRRTGRSGTAEAGPTHRRTLDSSRSWSWLGDYSSSIGDGSSRYQGIPLVLYGRLALGTSAEE